MNIWKMCMLSVALVASGSVFADKTMGQGVDDTTLQTEVKAKLLGNDFFGGSAINTEVRKRVVQLGGWVDDAAEGQRAAKVAASVDGVVKVDNQLHAKQGKASMGQKLDDTVITTKAKAAIGDADLGDGFKVNVDTYNGVVLLTGFVDTAEKKATAGTVTRTTANVKSVINGVYVLD